MKLPARRDPARAIGETQHVDARNEPRPEVWAGGPQLITRLATGGLWLMLAAGPVALALALATSLTEPQPRPAAQAAQAGEVTDEHARTAVGEFAQQFVVDWLQTPRGQEDRLRAYGLLDLETQQPEIARHVSFPAVARAAEVEPGLWSVTVGVTVTDSDADGTGAGSRDASDRADDPAPGEQIGSENSAGMAQRAPERRYFQVSVEHRDGLLAAQALPAAVPEPPTAGHSRLIYDETVDASDPLGEAMGSFLSALLTGEGEVGRYTAPDADITAVAAQPYLEVSVVGIRADDAPDPDVQPEDGARVHVLVTAVARTHAHQEVTVQYPLTLIARPGRWEVVEIAPAARRAGTDS